MTDHTGRTPGADHVPGSKGLEDEIREKNPDLVEDAPSADEIDERDLVDDPDEERR